MFTEEEAATKWCPFNVAQSSNARCIGSECMVWVWGSKAPPPTTSNSPPPKGYCGLCVQQGKP